MTIIVLPVPSLGSMQTIYKSIFTHSAIKVKNPGALSVYSQWQTGLQKWQSHSESERTGMWWWKMWVETVSYESLSPCIEHHVWHRVGAQKIPVQWNLTYFVPLGPGFFTYKERTFDQDLFSLKSQAVSSANQIWMYAEVGWATTHCAWTVSGGAPQILCSLTNARVQLDFLLHIEVLSLVEVQNLLQRNIQDIISLVHSKKKEISRSCPERASREGGVLYEGADGTGTRLEPCKMK